MINTSTTSMFLKTLISHNIAPTAQLGCAHLTIKLSKWPKVLASPMEMQTRMYANMSVFSPVII